MAHNLRVLKQDRTVAPVVEVQYLNHWTAKEIPVMKCFNQGKCFRARTHPLGCSQAGHTASPGGVAPAHQSHTSRLSQKPLLPPGSCMDTPPSRSKLT